MGTLFVYSPPPPPTIRSRHSGYLAQAEKHDRSVMGCRRRTIMYARVGAFGSVMECGSQDAVGWFDMIMTCAVLLGLQGSSVCSHCMELLFGTA